MKVYTYRVGSRRVRATPRVGTKSPAKRLKRHWAPYKHRELILCLIGLAFVLTCITPVPLFYWYRIQEFRRFEIEAAQGRPSLTKVEVGADHGHLLLVPNTAYDYGDLFPTS